MTLHIQPWRSNLEMQDTNFGVLAEKPDVPGASPARLCVARIICWIIFFINSTIQSHVLITEHGIMQHSQVSISRVSNNDDTYGYQIRDTNLYLYRTSSC